MNHIEITVPQMGEGLVEARIVSFLKRVGESVKRDEPLVEMETDKAVLVVESPVDGIIENWQAPEGETLPIGTVIGILSTSAVGEPDEFAGMDEGALDGLELPVKNNGSAVNGGTLNGNGLNGSYSNGSSANGASAYGVDSTIGDESASVNGLPQSGSPRNASISPRVRAFCQAQNISSEQMGEIPREDDSAPLRIADVERWLEAQKPQNYRDRTLSARQKTMSQRLSRAWNQAVPASIEMECNWDAIQQARIHLTGRLAGVRRPSSLNLIAWCVVKAMEKHPRFRSALIGESTLREYQNVTLGIAVGLPDDDLATASVPDADKYDFAAFSGTLQNSIAYARAGHDTTHNIQLTISMMANKGIHYAVPVIVPPAVSTLFVGSPYDVPRRASDDSIRWEKVAQLVLTIDHRIVNGIGGAQFLQEIRHRIANLPVEFPA